jgi:hypothetical protein
MPDLRYVMPIPEQFPPGWEAPSWWDLHRGDLARVYLNGLGTDHELRFIVWANEFGHYDLQCLRCQGGGRVDRPAEKPVFLIDIFSEDREPDPADENGLRKCHGCGGTGRVKPLYGASNDFCRVPGLENHFRNRVGGRGLTEPTLEDVLLVIKWCDWVIDLLRAGQTPEQAEQEP